MDRDFEQRRGLSVRAWPHPAQLRSLLQAVCQPVLRRAAQERPVRTSLDLELDLQASLTRQSRLNDELQALRGLRQKLEELKAQGQTDLPPGVLDDERFQKLLKQAEKQVRKLDAPYCIRGEHRGLIFAGAAGAGDPTSLAPFRNPTHTPILTALLEPEIVGI